MYEDEITNNKGQDLNKDMDDMDIEDFDKKLRETQ